MSPELKEAVEKVELSLRIAEGVRSLPNVLVPIQDLRLILQALRASEAEMERLKAQKPEKRAPVQGWAGGIPWYMHLRAYEGYCKRYGAQPALVDLDGRNCRGGFGVEELDMFIPGWRDELSDYTAMKARAKSAEAALAAALEEVQAIAEISGDRASAGFNEAGRLARINDRARALIQARRGDG